jgi:hypothetical protein
MSDSSSACILRATKGYFSPPPVSRLIDLGMTQCPTRASLWQNAVTFLTRDKRAITKSQVQVWAEVLAHELNHRSRDCLHGHVACEVFQDAKSALKAYTLRRRREIFDWINELTLTLIQGWAVHTQRQADTVRRLAVETWLLRNGVITITQNKEVLPILLERFAHN